MIPRWSGTALEAYQDLAFINRVSGGARAVRRGLERFAKPVTDRPWRVLDVGFGGADFWPVIRAWAAARGADGAAVRAGSAFQFFHPSAGVMEPRDLILTGDALCPPSSRAPSTWPSVRRRCITCRRR
jgi:hypothetical protein